MANRFAKFIQSGDTYLQRDFLLEFSRRGHWIDEYFKGFTHVRVASQGNNNNAPWIWFDPAFEGALQYTEDNPTLNAIRVRTCTSDANLVCRLKPQTCATIVQYVMGIWLGAYRPEKLYRMLTQYDDAWLFSRGVMEVESWGHR